MSAKSQKLANFIKELTKIEVDLLEFDMAGFYLREIQNVV
jgi:hypothetical protein